MTQQWRFSPANQWSAEFARHVLVTVRIAWNPGRGGTKKYQVQYPVENPPKVNRTEPYRAVPCSGKAPLDWRRMATGDERISKLATARGPIRLLRCFNGESWLRRRISEEGSLSLKRRNLRCGKAAAYIARRPAHFGELLASTLTEPLIRFLVLHEPMDVQLHCVIKKRLQLKRKKLFSHTSVSVFDAVRVKYRKGMALLLWNWLTIWSCI